VGLLEKKSKKQDFLINFQSPLPAQSPQFDLTKKHISDHQLTILNAFYLVAKDKIKAFLDVVGRTQVSLFELHRLEEEALSPLEVVYLSARALLPLLGE